MAESNRVYKIIIETTSTKKKSPVAGDHSKSDSNKAKDSDAVKGFSAVISYQKAKNLAISLANAEVSRVSLRTGSNELQQRASLINSVVQRTYGFVENVAIGAGTGGWVGAIIGAVTSVATMGIDYAQKTETLNLQKTIENETLRQNLIRAGAGGSRRNYE